MYIPKRKALKQSLLLLLLRLVFVKFETLYLYTIRSHPALYHRLDGYVSWHFLRSLGAQIPYVSTIFALMNQRSDNKIVRGIGTRVEAWMYIVLFCRAGLSDFCVMGEMWGWSVLILLRLDRFGRILEGRDDLIWFVEDWYC